MIERFLLNIVLPILGIFVFVFVVFPLWLLALAARPWELRTQRKNAQALRRRRLTVSIILAGLLAMPHPSSARDDGRYAASPLKEWFDSLKSGKGPCCSDADGYAVSDPDWLAPYQDGNGPHYRVRIEGEWHDVPDDAVITEPNRAGRAMVWPIKGWGGLTIRCFMPGPMT